MSSETYPAGLQAMIDRAGSLTASETDALGQLWESDEGLVLPNPSVFLELAGLEDYPVVTNKDLVDAWERALDAAGNAGRANEFFAWRLNFDETTWLNSTTGVFYVAS